MTAPALVASDSAQLSESTPEALHLRRVIERQPACLLRVGIDGLLLAANEAAVNLLGAEGLSQVLGSKLTERIIRRHHEEWDEFVARTRDGASGSIECDLTDLSGIRRTVLLQGVPLLDHADGIPSMILAARDTSAYRRLETALREREVSKELDDLQKQLHEQVSSDRPSSETSVDEPNADQQRPVAEHAAEWAQRQQTLAEEHQAALVAKEQEGRQLLDQLRTDLEQAVAERQRLTTLIDERETDHQGVVAALTAAGAQRQQTLAEEHQAALVAKGQEGRHLLDQLRTDLEQAVAERQRLTTLIDERETDHQRVVAALTAAGAQRQQTLAEEHQAALVAKEQEGRHLLDQLRTDLEQAVAERQRLTTLIDERETDHQRVVAALTAAGAQRQQTLAEEHQAALLAKEQEGRHLLDPLRTDLEQAVAERQRLATSLHEREADHHRVVAEQAAEQAQLRQTLTEAHQLALLAQEREGRQLLDQLRTDLEQAVAERRQLTTLLDERETDHRRLQAEYVAERAQLRQTLTEEHQLALLAQEREGRALLNQLRTDLEQTVAERQRLTTLLDERETDHQRLQAEHAAERAQLRQTLAEERQLALLLKEREGRQLLDAQRTELAQALAERQRLATLLDVRQTDHQRVVAEHAAGRAQAEQDLVAALFKQAEIEKALADQRVELQSLDENARNLEWLAAAGRAALEIGRELQTVFEAVDARTQYLLAQSSPEAADRHVIEALRDDAIGAASLTRQIVQATAKAPNVP